MTDKQTKVMWFVGDGANGSADAHKIADMIASDKPELFCYGGDIYESGTAEEVAHNYSSVYGQLDDIVLATPGNHDFRNYATGYQPYFAKCKLMHGKGTYYSYRFGKWQILSINSEEPHDAGSSQYKWLQGELSKSQYGKRRIAFWHRPRYCSGSHGDAPDMDPIWQLMIGRVPLVLSGHAHDLQRLKPDRGTVQIISGAGGRSHYATILDDPRLDFADPASWGASKIELDGNHLKHSFVDENKTVLDEFELEA